MDDYTALAAVYDLFMDNVDYAAWSDRIEEILTEHGIRDGLVLDLGCGTGQITERLAAKGYDMTGVDISEEMLQQAVLKRDASGLDILYLQQDMRAFELYGTMRAIVSTCDCVNYITEPEELLQVFRLVSNYLDPGGLFVFDFNTKAKYAGIGETSIAEARQDASFIWENYWDEEESINEYQLTLFLPAGEASSGSGEILYRKAEEYHVQRGYNLNEIKGLLESAGMLLLKAYNGYTEQAADEQSERIVILAQEREKTGRVKTNSGTGDGS